MNLSAHFTLAELTYSDNAARMGIDNQPPPEELKNLTVTANHMEQVRKILGHPILVSSGYRNPEVNRLAGGTHLSHHCQGWAVDFTCPGFGTAKEVATFLSKVPNLDFDQIIYEKTWVHISFAPGSRRQILTAVFGPHSTSYLNGIQ